MDRSTRTVKARNAILTMLALGETRRSIEEFLGVPTGTCRRYINGDQVPQEQTLARIYSRLRDVWSHRVQFLQHMTYPDAANGDEECESARDLHSLMFPGVRDLARAFAHTAQTEADVALIAAELRQMRVEFPPDGSPRWGQRVAPGE